MQSASEQSSVIENRFDELIAEYLHSIQAGQGLDRKQLLREHPALAGELQEFFDDHDWMHGLAGEPFFSDEESVLEDSEMSLGTTIIGAPASRQRESQNRNEKSATLLGTFGDYDLLKEIGRGGMGVIYKARQRGLNRSVALKMIRSNHLASQEDVDRFRGEAELAAGLDHPGIVPIFEVGEQAGQHYYSMGLVEGLSLGELLLKEQVLAPQMAAELVGRVATAIDYAHGKGVVHRDLKPANILLAPSPTQTGIVLKIDGVEKYCDPRVTDFGLAKRVESESGLTGTGQILGTPSYMAPEQAAGNVTEVGPLADVYALGAVLYCLLSGRPPFRAANVLETLKQVIHDEPVPPRQLNSAIPRDLETICLKCLNKAPGRRYGSALELAQDLKRFRDGEPVHARPAGVWERWWKWIKRRPTAASLVVVTFIAALASVGLGVSYTYQVERERILYARSTMSALQWFQNADQIRARNLLESDLLENTPQHLKGFELAFLHRLVDPPKERVWDGNSFIPSSQKHGIYNGLGVDIKYDRTGQYLAASVGRGPVLIWDVKAGSDPVKLEGHSKKVQGLAFSADSRLLATAGNEGRIKIWTLADQQCCRTLAGHVESILGKDQTATDRLAMVNSVDFSPNDQYLVSAGSDGTVRRWNVSTGEFIVASESFAVDSPGLEVHDAVFSPDGQLIAAACTDGLVRLLDPLDLTLTGTLETSRQAVVSVSFHPLSRRLAVGGRDGKLCIWDVQQRREVVFCEGHRGKISSLVFSSDGDRVASAGMDDKTIRIWEAATGRLMEMFAANSGNGSVREFGQITFHPDGRHVAMTSDDNLVRIWNLGSGREAQAISAHVGPVRAIDFRTDGMLATAGEDGIVKLWTTNTRLVEVNQKIVAHTGAVNGIAFSPEGQQLCSVGLDKSVKLWNTVDGQLAWEGKVHHDKVYALAFHPKGQSVATSSHDGQIVVWDIRSGRDLAIVNHQTEDGVNSPASCLAFHPAGGFLAVGSWDRNITLYSFIGQSLLPVKVLTGHEREVLTVAYSRDGRYLTSGDRDGRIIVWDAQRWRKLSQLPGDSSLDDGHLGPVTAALFSTAGNRVVSSGWDGLLNIWDVNSSQVTLTLHGRHGRTCCLTLSGHEDQHFASGHHDGTVMLWGR